MLGGVVAEMLALLHWTSTHYWRFTEETMKNMVIKTLDFLSGLLVVLALIGGVLWAVCGFHADSDTHSTHIRTVIPR